MHLNVIPWDVNPEIFRIGSFAIRWYGLLFGFFFPFRIYNYAPDFQK
jgi:prolipoprotein diacylglyceryltransferase